MAKNTKENSYLKEFQKQDLQSFRDKLEESLDEVTDPRVSDNQKYSFSSHFAPESFYLRFI